MMQEWNAPESSTTIEGWLEKQGEKGWRKRFYILIKQEYAKVGNDVGSL
jgi:hypothetical protein